MKKVLLIICLIFLFIQAEETTDQFKINIQYYLTSTYTNNQYISEQCILNFYNHNTQIMDLDGYNH